MWCSHAVPWHKMKRHRFWGIFDSCAFFELKNALRPIQTLLNFKSIYSVQSARSTLWLFRRTVNHSKSVNISKLYFSESEVQCVHSKQPVVLLFVQGGERLGAAQVAGNRWYRCQEAEKNGGLHVCIGNNDPKARPWQGSLWEINGHRVFFHVFFQF